MEWRVTVLCENTVPVPGLIGEHGFAALVESPNGIILFDTGQGFGLIANANRLKKDLRQVDKLVFSHGHFDHTGGLLAFLGIHGPVPVVAHEDVLLERFRLMPIGPTEKQVSIGIPWTESYVTTRGAIFQFTSEFSEVIPGAYVTGEVPRVTDFETGDPKFSIKQNGSFIPDPFRDDYSLILKSSKGLIVILGCAHAGLINILKYAAEKTGIDKVHAVLGGTHLGFSAEEQLTETIKALKADFDVDILAVSHCTGQKPIARLAAEFGEKFDFAPVSYTLEV